VTGETPFNANDPYQLLKMHNEQEPRFPRLDPQMLAVLQRCLRKDPRRRYATLSDLEGDLAQIAGLKKASPRRPAAGGGDSGLPEGVRWLLVGIGLLVFLVLAYLLREQVMSAFKAWWSPVPTRRAQL
jgi:hypothetical protein